MLHPAIDTEVVLNMVQNDTNEGFCLACGAEAYGVEPDAEGYRCASCGKHKVMGAANILLRYI